MEHTMASKPITYQAEPETPAPHGFAGSGLGKLVAFASAFRAYGKHADAAPLPWSLSAWFGTIAARCMHAIAMEVRIRRDARRLMFMSDRMLKDIGLTRAEIGGVVRYGRER
jgi:uncharacterized protein YjiS (DUF1127 family)